MSLCRSTSRLLSCGGARLLSLRAACSERYRQTWRFYSSKVSRLEEKRSRALLAGGQRRLDKQHKSVRHICVLFVWESSLGARPFAQGVRKGLGTHPHWTLVTVPDSCRARESGTETTLLSPDWNANLTNQNRWMQLTSWKGFLLGFQCCY